jgi:hypothetical protein
MNDPEVQRLLATEHLRLLRLGYLISGCVNAAFACFPLLHVAVGVMLVTQESVAAQLEDGARFGGWLFIIMGLAFSSVFAVMATLKLIAAGKIRERSAKTFCLVVAGLTCLGIPYGTALGVFTFVVLGRPEVDALFQGERSKSPDPIV